MCSKRSSVGWKHSTPPKSKMTARGFFKLAASPAGPIRRLRLTPRTNLTHGVNAPALALKIRARQDFAQQTGAEENHAGHQRKRARHHQRSVLQDDVLTRPDL